MDRAAILNEDEVRAALGELRERLEALLGPRLRKVVLYGSRARGDADPDSDVDVAVVVAGLDSRMRDRILDEVAHIETDLLVPLSVIVLTEARLRALAEGERRLGLDIEQEGIPL